MNVISSHNSVIKKKKSVIDGSSFLLCPTQIDPKKIGWLKNTLLLNSNKNIYIKKIYKKTIQCIGPLLFKFSHEISWLGSEN